MIRFFYSLISFITALFFILLGVVSVLMPWVPSIRSDIIGFLIENSIAISLFGLAFLTIGIVMVINIILGTKRHYYEFKVGQNPVGVDEDLIQKYLQAYFIELFPVQEIPCCLAIKQNRLHITADLPYVPATQRAVLLEKIQQDLQDLFRRQLGYHDDYYLSASFQSEKSSEATSRKSN